MNALYIQTSYTQVHRKRRKEIISQVLSVRNEIPQDKTGICETENKKVPYKALILRTVIIRRSNMAQTLLPIFPAESTQINAMLSFVKRKGKVWYFYGCMPVFSHEEKDYSSFNMYTSQLVVIGQCKQIEIVKAFGVSTISVKRHVKRYREGGPGVFFQKRQGRNATVLREEVLCKAQEMFNNGKSREEVSEHLEIKPDTLYRAIHSGRLVEIKKKVKAKVSVA